MIELTFKCVLSAQKKSQCATFAKSLRDADDRLSCCVVKLVQLDCAEVAQSSCCGTACHRSGGCHAAD